MKKFLMVLALASVSVAGMAQNETPELKYSVATNSFWSNWFISADVMYGAFYSNEEKGNDFKKSPFTDYRRNLGASVAVGKWFTPGLGLRTKFQGIWGKHVLTDNADDNAIKFWNLQEQVLFNLSNLFCGYSETRVWNLIPYVGVGVLRNCSDNEYTHGGSIGLLNTWKIGKKVMLNFDLGMNISDDDYANANGGHGGYGHSIASTDRYFSAEVGLTFNLGKATWKKVPDVDALKALHQSQIDALNAQLQDEQAENDRLKKMIADHKCPEAKTVTVKEVSAAPVSVFFNIGKSKIASRKDLQNVKELAEIAKNQNSKLVVTGYADSKTGSAAFNQKLSQKRAETVTNELVKMGVSRDNIEVVAAGGVNTLTPVSYNRRATVAIK
jgi:outer membrane protein OmpA-like peptidoglycan-associated protein